MDLTRRHGYEPEPPLHLTADQWEEAQRANSDGYVGVPQDKLKLLQGKNCKISDGVSALKDFFWWLEDEKREKETRARKRRQRSSERRQRRKLPPPPEEEKYYSATEQDPATDAETDADLRSDADTSSERDEDEDMESNEEQEENCMQTVGTQHRVDTSYVDDDERVGDDDGDGSYDGDDSDEEMADGAGGDDGDHDDNDDEDTRGLDVPESISVLTQHAQIQIGAFFIKHPVTLEMCHQHVAAAMEKEVEIRPVDIQLSDGCYTCYVDNTNEVPEDSMTLVQFLERDLDLSQVATAAELYGNLVPSFQSLGTLGSGPLHVWKLVCPRGVPLGRALDELNICPVGEDEVEWDENEDNIARLANMVTDLVK